MIQKVTKFVQKILKYYRKIKEKDSFRLTKSKYNTIFAKLFLFLWNIQKLFNESSPNRNNGTFNQSKTHYLVDNYVIDR